METTKRGLTIYFCDSTKLNIEFPPQTANETAAMLKLEEILKERQIIATVDGAVLIGRKAIEAYVDGAPGRLMRSLKSVLGTSLIDETTRLGRERTSFRDVIAYYLGAVKRRAEQATGLELRDVVHGRPVHFVDNAPDADRKAEQTLQQIAREIGFDDVTFQFEPIAAALEYERQITSEEVALIADIGGGTSDFSIVRLGPERHTKATANTVGPKSAIRDRRAHLFFLPATTYSFS